MLAMLASNAILHHMCVVMNCSINVVCLCIAALLVWLLQEPEHEGAIKEDSLQHSVPRSCTCVSF